MAYNTFTITGAGKAKRLAAANTLARVAYDEVQSRASLVSAIRLTLGDKPSDELLRAVRTEVQIGRLAARMPAAEFPANCKTPEQRLAFAADVVLRMAAAPQEGKATRPLRAGQINRRTVGQHKAFRAADEAWSQLLAETGHGKAKTATERNKAKRNPSGKTQQNAPKGGKSKLVAPPEYDVLASDKAKPVTADDACRHVEAQASALLAFANKHAKLMPASYGTAIQTFKAAINVAANEREVGKAIIAAANRAKEDAAAKA